MPRFGPIERKDSIHYLKQLSFEGPYSGGKHQFMIKRDITLRLPNPHQSDIGKSFWLEYCGRPKLTGMSGKNSEGLYTVIDRRICALD